MNYTLTPVSCYDSNQDINCVIILMTVCQLEMRLLMAAVKDCLDFLTASQWTTSTNRDDSGSLLSSPLLSPWLSEAVIMKQNKHAVLKNHSHVQFSQCFHLLWVNFSDIESRKLLMNPRIQRYCMEPTSVILPPALLCSYLCFPMLSLNTPLCIHIKQKRSDTG